MRTPAACKDAIVREGITERCRAMLESGTRITLDGKSARIVSWATRFANIRNSEQTVEYSWEACEQRIAKGGSFDSA